MKANASPEPKARDGRSMPADDAAARALAEAEARRRARDLAVAALPAEVEFNGRPGPEPVRYGDWENKGIASDF